MFGGTNTNVEYNTTLNQSLKNQKDVTKSAYMLVYVRADSNTDTAITHDSGYAVFERKPGRTGTALINSVNDQNKRFLYRRLVMRQTFVFAVTRVLKRLSQSLEGCRASPLSCTINVSKSCLQAALKCAADCAILVALTLITNMH